MYIHPALQLKVHFCVRQLIFVIADKAFGVAEVDLVNIIAKEKDDDITLEPEVFMSKPAYKFAPSTAVNTLVSEVREGEVHHYVSQAKLKH